MSMTNKVSPKSAILFFFRRHSVLYSALAVVLLCAAVLEALSVAALFPVMTVVLRGESVGGGRVLAVLQQMSQIVPSQDRLQATVVLLIGVITLKSVIIVLRDYLIASGGAKAVYGIKQEMFSRIAQAPYQYFLDRRQAPLQGSRNPREGAGLQEVVDDRLRHGSADEAHRPAGERPPASGLADFDGRLAEWLPLLCRVEHGLGRVVGCEGGAGRDRLTRRCSEAGR